MPYLLPETAIRLDLLNASGQQVPGAITRLRAYVSIDGAAPVELASSVAGQGTEVGAASDPGAYQWALTPAERTFAVSLRFSGHSTSAPAESVVPKNYDPEDNWYTPTVASVPAPAVPLSGSPFGFAWNPNQGTNLRVFVPAGTNIVSTTGALIPDAASNRASAGIPVAETYAGSGYYTFAIPAGTPPGYYPQWQAYRLTGATFGGPGVDTLVDQGGAFAWNGVPVALVPPSGTQYGYYTSQPRMENRRSAGLIAITSDLDSTLGSANPTVLRQVLDDVDGRVNRKARVHDYVTPIPPTSADYSYLSDLATDLAWCLLYLSRGIVDTGGKDGGKFAKLLEDTEYRIDLAFAQGVDAPTVSGSVSAPLIGGLDLRTGVPTDRSEWCGAWGQRWLVAP